MKIIYIMIRSVGMILLLNFIINLMFVSKNDGEGYVEEYIEGSKEVKVKVDPNYFDGQISHTSFLKYTIFFKGIYGSSGDFMIKDNFSQKYFKIMRFGKYDTDYGLPQTTMLDDEELYIKADFFQLENPDYGTKQNPILVFSYKAANKELMIGISTDEMGEDGRYINKSVPLAPSEEEYRYNIEQYLTYVMPKKEFKQRFEKIKDHN